MYHKFFAEKIIEELEKKRLAKSDLVRASGINRGFLEQILAGTAITLLSLFSKSTLMPLTNFVGSEFFILKALIVTDFDVSLAIFILRSFHLVKFE